MTNSYPVRLAPSILSADFARLADEVDEVAPIADLLHVDIMDGHYVPNLTIGPVVVRWLRQRTELPFDTHLMITDPRTYAPQFIAAGSTSITFHPATDIDPVGLARLIHDAGAEVGIAIRPSERAEQFVDLLGHADMTLCMTVEPGFAGQAFMPSGVANVAAVVELRARHGFDCRIEVDGGISAATAATVVAAGADTLVAGSAIFDHADRVAAARAILDAAADVAAPVR
ncbi:MAG: ribulose-phosphate 3-epimerase [Actinobacteria bacterium]|nr:ribulose-phosphate 3-epimerase [Actinomycetota bacterium]